MEIRLNDGESLFVTFNSSDDKEDGIKIDISEDRLVVSSVYEDDQGRQGEIYCATFDNSLAVDDKLQSNDFDRDEIIKTVCCNSCGESFDFTKGEQRFMKKMFKGSYHDPVRCKECRKIRKNKDQYPNGKKVNE